MQRDYRADAPQFDLADLRKQTQVIHDPSFVLPDADYYKSPTDPDGTKGLRQWNREHEPKGHSGRNRPGGREMKTSF